MNFDAISSNRLVAACAATLLFSAFPVCAQQPKSPEFKVEEGLFVFERIEAVDLNKKEIVSHTAAFIAEKFKSSKQVLELRDDELGKIVGDIVLHNPDAGMFDGFKSIKARLIVEAKDGRYRLRITNITGIDGNGNISPWGQIEGANQYRLEPLAEKVLPPFATDFKGYLAKAKSNNNW